MLRSSHILQIEYTVGKKKNFENIFDNLSNSTNWLIDLMIILCNAVITHSKSPKVKTRLK